MKPSPLGTTPAKDLVFSAPLYTSESGSAEGVVAFLKSLRSFVHPPLDHYCPGCGKDTLWTKLVPLNVKELVENGNKRTVSLEMQLWLGASRHFEVTYYCNRNLRHTFKTFFTADPEDNDGQKYVVTKAGQFPSMVDMGRDASSYEKALDEESKTEFRAARTLSSYGFNIAAFVHLRRVIENLIERSAVEAQAEEGTFDIARFREATCREKVRILGDRMPQFLADRPEIYRLLSEGVHSWEESECAKALPLLQLAIKIVLEQEIERKTKLQRERDVAIALQQLANPG